MFIYYKKSNFIIIYFKIFNLFDIFHVIITIISIILIKYHIQILLKEDKC